MTLEQAAQKLLADIEGTLGAFECSIRGVIGNTNYQCIVHRAAALRAALAAPVGEGQRLERLVVEWLDAHECVKLHGLDSDYYVLASRSSALREAAQRIRDAAAPHLAEAGGWIPASRKPGDCAPVLMTVDLFVGVGHWSEGDQRWVADDDEEYDIEPTHWMPMPRPASQCAHESAGAAGEQSAAPPKSLLREPIKAGPFTQEQVDRGAAVMRSLREPPTRTPAPTESSAAASGPSAGDALGESGSVPASASNPTARENRTVAAAHPVGLQAEPVAWRCDFEGSHSFTANTEVCTIWQQTSGFVVTPLYAEQERPAERAQVPRDTRRDCTCIQSCGVKDGARLGENWRCRVEHELEQHRNATGATP